MILRIKKPARTKPALLSNVALVHSGEEFFKTLVYLINQAKKEIHLQFYIIAHDGTGRVVLDALVAAARRGVKVFVLADGYASSALHKETVENLRKTGVWFRFFEPFFKSRRFFFGRRLHRKVVTADGNLALVGGINVSDSYNDTPGSIAWKDYAVLLQGEAAFELQKVCRRSWQRKHRFRQQAYPALRMPAFIGPVLHEQPVRIRHNDWLRKRRDISLSYMELLNTAKSKVTIMCSYFLPDVLIRTRLEKAAQRGVQIRVILTQMSDVPVFKRAERFLYNWMLTNGMEIYEYRPAVVHAKVGISDDRWTTIGSYNINSLSAFASVELNMDIFSAPFTTELRREMDNIIQSDCLAITREEHTRESWFFGNFLNWGSYQLMRISMALASFRIRG